MQFKIVWTKALKTLKRATIKTFKLALGWGAATLAVGATAYLGSRLPELHDQYLYTAIGAKTYMVQIAADKGGGSGFAMTAKSGATYIITNDHVCEHAEDGKMLITAQDGRVMWRRVIERSDFTDICVIEGMPGDKGLKLGEPTQVGDTVYALGHPRLRPLTLTSGMVIAKSDLPILDFVFPTGDALMDLMLPVDRTGRTCDLPKNQIMEYPIILKTPLNPEGVQVGVIRLCMVVTKNSSITTVVGFPGSSGSAVVDYWGNVIGILFSGDDTNWSNLVSQEDLAKVLNKY